MATEESYVAGTTAAPEREETAASEGTRTPAPEREQPPKPEREDSPAAKPKIWVELEIDRAARRDCPVAGLSNTSARGTVQLTGSRCHVTLSYEGQEDVSVHTARMTDTCACSWACGTGVTPANLAVEGGSLVIGAYVSDRDRLRRIVDFLREHVQEWRLRRLTTPERNRALEGDAGQHVFPDVPVTDKQREAVEAAVEMGYYAEPREATLEDLANKLGVSTSALSQRLNAVESKLVESLAAEL